MQIYMFNMLVVHSITEYLDIQYILKYYAGTWSLCAHLQQQAAAAARHTYY